MDPPNGGGIYTGAPLILNKSIIANSNSGGDCKITGAGTVSAVYSLIEETGAAACNHSNGIDGNVIGQDPYLGALQDNGGASQTHALLTGSPAIDMADDSTCAAGPVNGLDQRGVVRPQGSGCDIGAFELATPLAVTLGWFLAERNGETVDVRWQTATENGTAGFHLLAVTESVNQRLNADLIPSTVIDSVTPTDYQMAVQTDATQFLLQEVGIAGDVTEMGPFELGFAAGARSETESSGPEGNGPEGNGPGQPTNLSAADQQQRAIDDEIVARHATDMIQT